jgi:hypothetical protein
MPSIECDVPARPAELQETVPMAALPLRTNATQHDILVQAVLSNTELYYAQAARYSPIFCDNHLYLEYKKD